MPERETDETLFVRERLIRGAISLIESEGCSSLGVRRLAQSAERTTMCVYSKFGSRGGLLSAVYARVAGELTSTLGEAPDRPAAYRHWAREHVELYTLLFDQPLDALDIAPGARQELVVELAGLLATPTESGPEAWSRAHGAVSFDRIAARGQAVPA